MAQPALPTEDEIIAAARAHGYLNYQGRYDVKHRRRLMNLALDVRKTRRDASSDFGRRAVTEVLEVDLYGPTVERLHEFYQDSLVTFGNDERAFALTLAIAPALVTRSGLHIESEGTAPDDHTTDEEDRTEEGDDENIAATIGYSEHRDG